MDNCIDITKVDLKKFVKEAYALSSPRGVGFLHARDGVLSDEDADAIIARGATGRNAVSMDYVHGRACKMNVFRDEEGKLWVRDKWYDHSEEDLIELLARTAA